ncbi:MAG: hypothetical protein AzoDbin1_00913 [Azoarcus sp.]|nr:hypothetical protein [Azoarcus sp.]
MPCCYINQMTGHRRPACAHNESEREPTLKTKLKTTAFLVALALGGTAGGAFAAGNAELEATQQQLRQLQEAVRALQDKLHKIEADSSTKKVATAEPEPEVTKDDLNGLRSDLENFKYQYNRNREYNTAVTTRPVNLSGIVQARFGSNSVRNGNNLAPNTTNSNERHSSFNNGSAALQMSGLLFRDYEDGRNLAYTLRLAANPSQATGPNANSNIYLQFANLTYNFLPTLSPEDPRLTATLGQQLLPFGLDAAAPDELKPTINGAQFVNALGLGLDIGLIARGEVGVQYDYGYSYRTPTLAWYAGALNGSGPNTSDNNNNKDWFGRAVFTVPADYNSWLRQLAFGVSAYKGTQNTAIIGGTRAGTLSGTGRKDRFGFDLYYNHDPIGFTYEYVKGKDGRSFGGANGVSIDEDVESRGQVFTAYYNIGQQFLYANSALGTVPVSTGRFDDWWPKSYQFFFRYDKFDPAVGKNDARHGFKQDIATLGLNVFFAQTTKFQLNYNVVDSDQPGRDVDRQLLGQFQFGF